MVVLAFISYIFKAFIDKEGLVIVKLFKAAKVGVVNNIKEINRRDLR